MIMNNTVRDRCRRYIKKAVIVPIVGVKPCHLSLKPDTCTLHCAVGLRVLCWLHNINLVETLKLVKYLWTEIRNLDGNLDGIGDFGRTENEILDSMFVQSLYISI